MITTNGECFDLKNKERLSFNDNKIIKISDGFAITSNGDSLVWGPNPFFQLGLGHQK